MKEYEGLTDDELGRALVRDGWRSTSNKYRLVSRLRVPLTGKDIVRPELHNSAAGKLIIDQWDRIWSSWILRCGDDRAVETLELTLGQFTSFRANKGQTA